MALGIAVADHDNWDTSVDLLPGTCGFLAETPYSCDLLILIELPKGPGFRLRFGKII